MSNTNGYNNGNGHNQPATALFQLGHVVATLGAKEELDQRPGLRLQLLARHMSGDWGDLCQEDKDLNDLALKPDSEGRIFSAYQVTEELRLWIITEWDRSATTVLLPEEY